MEKLYTLEDMKKAFDSGFYSYSDIDRCNDPSEIEAIDEAKDEEFNSFLTELEKKKNKD